MEYQAALKLGEKAYRNAVARGEYPYLPALDEILSCVEVQREEKLGLVDCRYQDNRQKERVCSELYAAYEASVRIRG